MSKKALSGQRFGKRTVVSTGHRRGSRTDFVLCRCDCGHLGFVREGYLVRGKSTSCFDCAEPPGYRTHGQSKSLEYHSYWGMLSRCNRPSHNRHHLYKDKGVMICERWCGEGGFERFLSDMGPKPTEKHSIDRIDNDGDYSPENCRWATSKQQARNRKNTSMLTAHGVTRPVAEWAERIGVKYHTLRKRLLLGWTPEEAVTGKRTDRQRIIRSDTPFLVVNGERRPFHEWAAVGGISETTLKARVRKLGWAPEEAVFGKAVSGG